MRPGSRSTVRSSRRRCGGQTTGPGSFTPRSIPPARISAAVGGEIMAVSQEEHLKELSKGYRFDWKDPSHAVFQPKRGLSEKVVEEISGLKDEPDWMRKYRLKALKHFQA